MGVHARRLRRTASAAVLAMTLVPGVLAGAEDRPVVGWVEKAIFMPLGVTLKVKLDTGALTSSLDATRIEVFEKEGRRWVRFRVHLEDADTGEEVYKDMEAPVKRFVRLRGAGGVDRRPAVVLPLCIGDRIYREQFTLRDRDEMIYPVLIGRRTLEDLGPVDVRQTFVTEPKCEAKEAGLAPPAGAGGPPSSPPPGRG